ncbi:MAG: ribulose-phosphate 3-epimerase [Armatimonadota bacterium]
MKIKISPSLLSSDFSNLERDVRRVTEAGAESIHCDVMDGRFVPNLTFGPPVIASIRDKTNIPLIAHLMIEHPETLLSAFAKAGSDMIQVHVEACAHLHRTIQQIKELGVLAGVALNPHTPLCMIEHVIGDIDEILIMTVNPGFGGQQFITPMLPKIAEARKMADAVGREIDISVDGGVNERTARLVTDAGANVLVAGSFVFDSPDGVDKAMARLRR